MRAIHRLSAVKIAGLKRPGITPMAAISTCAGTKGWIFRFAIGGKTRDAGLGPYSTVRPHQRGAGSAMAMPAIRSRPDEDREASGYRIRSRSPHRAKAGSTASRRARPHRGRARKVRGHRQGENPAQWRGHLDQLLLSSNLCPTLEVRSCGAWVVPSDCRRRAD